MLECCRPCAQKEKDKKTETKKEKERKESDKFFFGCELRL